MMTLHTFDSCPYCTRVKALIGLKNLDVKVKTFPLGELEPSVAAKLEKFTVPILQLTSAAEKQTELMTESLDIFAFWINFLVPLTSSLILVAIHYRPSFRICWMI